MIINFDMKIIKERSRTYKEQAYYKYKINIPEMKLDDAGFKEGDELECVAEKGKIVLKRA